MSWFPMFLNLYALGTVGAMGLVPFRDIGKYYFKFHTTMALVLVAFATILGPQGPRAAIVGAYAFAASVLLQSMAVRASKERLGRGVLLLPPFIGIAFVLTAAFSADRGGLMALHLLSSAAVLGTSLVAMTTGHWYLSNAALSFDILARLARAFVLAVVAKTIVVGVMFPLFYRLSWSRLEDFDKLVIGVRVAAGIVFSLILALMSLACAKRKANQSATGILYVAVVFVLIGETISIYLTLGKGWPV